MSQLPDSLPKQPALNPAEDYYNLRRVGIQYLEQMGSRLWTDYNTHDPGITILEAVSYAFTDLAYRIGWDIKNLLAPPTPSKDTLHPYPYQPFFTARDILTVNPWTPDDLRRLLIDREKVRNAWVICKECACETDYYYSCVDGQLTLGHENLKDSKTVTPRGLYDVLLELESDPELGDLNDHKLTRTFSVFDKGGNGHALTIEVRFPDWGLARWDDWRLFLNSDALADPQGASFDLTVTLPNPDKGGAASLNNAQLQANWRSVIFANIEITLQPGGHKIAIDNATVRVFGDTYLRTSATVDDLRGFLEDKASSGFIQRYRQKLLRAQDAIADASLALHAHRNLDEDYCRVKTVAVEDVAVCADVEVAPNVDIERVQAQIWFEIEQYLNPPVPFYSLQELRDAGIPVEDIFNGPALDNGFLKAADLTAAGLKTVLRTSDIINRLMGIDGVLAINNLLLTKYDAAGNRVSGAADPGFGVDGKGKPEFDSSKVSASWLLYVSPLHQPRLYQNLSRFLFLKNGLPFNPRLDEAVSALTLLRGEAERPKIKASSEDLPIPAGAFRSPEEYSPVQYSFPLTYGIGPFGLPSTASELRRAQAAQLKAYLMVFEQLLGNAFAQVAHTADLFSLNPTVQHTYFVKQFDETSIAGYSDLVRDLNGDDLADMAETQPEFLERRNRFLNHIMARFGEDFGEYALLLTTHQGEMVALDQLIKDKIAFVQDYPLLSHDRARAIDYKTLKLGAAAEQPGLAQRIMRLLGVAPNAEQCIVVEHLLLRPKFPGDALYPACTDGPCTAAGVCDDADPYSFRLTVVMPGWVSPFDTDLEMRGFADRTIRQETPAHLLAKVCWVGNDGFVENKCDPVIAELAAILISQGLTATGQPPAWTDACDCADAIYKCFSAIFSDWYGTRTSDYFHEQALQVELQAEFDAKVKAAKFACTVLLDAALWIDIQARMLSHFHHIALYGWQFKRFKDAWSQWLEANAAIDWTQQRLQERVQAILTAGVPAGQKPNTAALCQCAADILAAYGTQYYKWMGDNIRAGVTLEDIKTTLLPEPVVSCADVKPETTATIARLLIECYKRYTTASYRLWIVTDLLSKLRNSYPSATLHDCDDGNDRNPMRLGQTALGSVL